MSSTTFQIQTPTARDWPIIAVSVALLGALIFLFHGGLENLWWRWGNQQELSHSYFIPVISAWILWERRDAMRASIGRPSALAIPLLLLGAFLVLALKQMHVFLLEHVGLMLALFAVPLLIGGVSLLRVAFIPLAYLVFMIPPPYWVITVTSWQFQLWSSELGVSMIRLFDVPVLLSGNVIELPSLKLQVVEACSGLRYLFPFLSLAALAAYFYKGPLWQRAIVVLSAIPITIVMNSFRIAITGVLSEKTGASHTEGFLHFFEGWVVFVLCIILLLTVLVSMARIFSGKKNVLASLGLPEVEPIKPRSSFDRALFVKLGGAVAAGLAVAAFAIHSYEAPYRYPERATFDELPLEFRGWSVREAEIDVQTERVIGADDVIILDMTSPEGDQFNLYTAYLTAQRNGQSWHSPAQCLPGGGWQFVKNEIITKRDGARQYGYNRILMQKGDVQYLVYYWYPQRGRNIANEFVMKFWIIWDVITRNRSDGAMMRIMTPVLPDEGGIAAAEERLQGFQARIDELIPKYVPAK